MITRRPLIFPLIILITLVLLLNSGVREKIGAYLFAQTPRSVKLGTFAIPLPNIKQPLTPMPPSPTITLLPSVTPGQAGEISVTPAVNEKDYYCLDLTNPSSCDNDSSLRVVKGRGGVSGSCGYVIDQGHRLVASLYNQTNTIQDALNPSVNNCGYNTASYSSGYISTFFVIDAYNLAGLPDMAKYNVYQAEGSQFLDWWQSPQASSGGYIYIPYSPTVLQQYADNPQQLTGCAIFFNITDGVRVGLINRLEFVDTHGNGIISILQSEAISYIDRFEVVNWNVVNSSINQTQMQSIAGFGCHQ